MTRQRILAAEVSALRADLGESVRILSDVRNGELDPDDAIWRTHMLDRFDRPAPPDDDAPAGFEHILAVYRSYWWHAGQEPENGDEHQAELIAALTTAICDSGIELRDRPTIDEVEVAVELLARKHGFHVLLGFTPPLRECMVWRTQRDAVERVELPNGPHDTPVVYLDDFLSFGWIDYATCSRRCANGWATDDTVFAVIPRYDSLDSEYFRINLLTHETQHLADKKRGFRLLPWELEYRAKLAELALAHELRDALIEKFSADRSNDVDLPHPYANAQVIDVVGDASDVSEAARDALIADTARRSSR